MRQRLILGLLALCFQLPVSGQMPVAPDPSRFRGWATAGFRIEGAPQELRGALQQGLSLSGTSKLVWKSYPPYSPDLLRADIARARLFLARHGYPRAEIRPRFEPRSQDRAVRVILQVDPGTPVYLAHCRARGAPPGLEAAAEAIVEIAAREIFADQRVERRTHALLRRLQDAGYATDPKYSSKIMGIVNGEPLSKAFDDLKLSRYQTITSKDGS